MVEMAAFESKFSRTGEMAMKVDRIRLLDDALDLIGDTTTVPNPPRPPVQARSEAVLKTCPRRCRLQPRLRVCSPTG